MTIGELVHQVAEDRAIFELLLQGALAKPLIKHPFDPLTKCLVHVGRSRTQVQCWVTQNKWMGAFVD